MIALAGLCVALAVGLAVAGVQYKMLADQVERLVGESNDRATSARAFAARALLEVAYDLHADAARRTTALKKQSAGMTPTVQTHIATGAADATRDIAEWIETVRVPAVSQGRLPAPQEVPS